NLSLTGSVSASSQLKGFEAEKAIDGRPSSWKSEATDTVAWLVVKLPGATEIFSIHIKTDAQPISDFEIQTMLNGTWRNVKEVKENTLNEVEVTLEKPVLSDRIRFFTQKRGAAIAELEIYGQ